MAVNNLLEMRKLFNMAQDGVVPSKLCDLMEGIQIESEEEQFNENFISHLQKTMVFYKTEKCVERVMDFVASFTTFATLKKQKEEKVRLDILLFLEGFIDLGNLCC